MLSDNIKEKQENKIIRMQYPYDSNGVNPLFDGQLHEIIPEELKPIILNGREFYVMSYYDVSMQMNAITLLTIIGNTVVKVPLDNYDILFDYLRNNPLPNNVNSLITLPPIIQLGPTMNAEELFGLSSPVVEFAGGSSSTHGLNVAAAGANPPQKPKVTHASVNPPENHYELSLESLDNASVYPKPVFKSEEYVTYAKTQNEAYGSLGGSYSFDKVIGESLNDRNYMFNKTPSFDAKNIILQRIINSLPNDDQMRRYKIIVDVPHETIGKYVSLDDQGNEKFQTVSLSPGTYEYIIRFVPCKYLEDCISSKYADSILVKTHLPENNKSFDDKAAFYYGCRRDIHTQIVFYNADLQRLDVGEQTQKLARR